jgi:hypothetical protein
MAVSRDEAADVQWARALGAVAIAFVIVSGQLCPWGAIPGQLMNFVLGAP